MPYWCKTIVGLYLGFLKIGQNSLKYDPRDNTGVVRDFVLITLQKASWPEWGHVQEWSILTVWPVGIMQHFTINEINMHNADTVLDKAPGQETFCTVSLDAPRTLFLWIRAVLFYKECFMQQLLCPPFKCNSLKATLWMLLLDKNGTIYIRSNHHSVPSRDICAKGIQSEAWVWCSYTYHWTITSGKNSLYFFHLSKFVPMRTLYM